MDFVLGHLGKVAIFAQFDHLYELCLLHQYLILIHFIWNTKLSSIVAVAPDEVFSPWQPWHLGIQNLASAILGLPFRLKSNLFLLWPIGLASVLGFMIPYFQKEIWNLHFVKFDYLVNVYRDVSKIYPIFCPWYFCISMCLWSLCRQKDVCMKQRWKVLFQLQKYPFLGLHRVFARGLPVPYIIRSRDRSKASICHFDLNTAIFHHKVPHHQNRWSKG